MKTSAHNIGGRLAALTDLGLLKTAKEFAPGIPAQKPISRLPSITPKTLNRWMLAVQDHEAAKAGKHYDLRLVDPDSNKAHSWAIPKARLPEPGEKLLAVQTFTHTPEYALHFGEKKPEIIPQGYGKGRVRMALKEPVDIVEANNDKVHFNVYRGKSNEEFVLRRTKNNKWLLQNVTLTKDRAGVPQSKPKYKETEPKDVDVTNDNQLMMAKVDGAHCFPSHIHVNTKEYGRVPIGVIVNQRLNVHVESADLENQTIVWKPIVRYFKRERTEKLHHLRIISYRNARIIATENHKIETPDGPKSVKLLDPGDKVWTIQPDLSPLLSQAVYGMMLGDASITKGTHHYRIAITHSKKQTEYCLYKYHLLEHFCNQEPQHYTSHNSYAPEKVRFTTKTLPTFNKLRTLFYDTKGNRRITPQFLEKLTEISLVFWFLDDGHVSVSNNEYGNNRQLFLGLHTEALSDEDNAKLVTWFQERWHIHTRVCRDARGHMYIGMGAQSTLQFLRLISPWLPNPCFKKLGENYYKYDARIKDTLGTRVAELFKNTEPVRVLHAAKVKENKIIDPEATTIPYKYVYNLEVADTHRYNVHNVLVGNCTMALNHDKPLRIFSYRPTERNTGIIEHTHRFLPGYKERIPKRLDGLVLRGELFAADPHTGRTREAVETGATLNSGVWKSRERQKHAPLRAIIFDVARRAGEDVESLPYTEKLKILGRVNKALPFLELPPMATTSRSKIDLLNRIRTGQEPITSEGVVLWPLGGGAPIKAKFRPDHDVYVREIFPETGKREGLAGGFRYSWTPRGKIVGHVGTGLKHNLKRDMLENPSKYLGRVARVRALGVYRDKENPKKPGALRAPSFQDWHIDKNLDQLSFDE